MDGRLPRFVLVFVFAALAALAAVSADEGRAESLDGEPMLGLWLTQDGDARIRIERCDDGLCGSIVWMSDPLDETGAPRHDVENPDPAQRDRPVQGMVILRIGAEADPPGVYTGGRIYDPKSGRTYRCNLRQDGDDALKMRGYLGISLLGRTTRWTRAEPRAEGDLSEAR